MGENIHPNTRYLQARFYFDEERFLMSHNAGNEIVNDLLRTGFLPFEIPSHNDDHVRHLAAIYNRDVTLFSWIAPIRRFHVYYYSCLLDRELAINDTDSQSSLEGSEKSSDNSDKSSINDGDLNCISDSDNDSQGPYSPFLAPAGTTCESPNPGEHIIHNTPPSSPSPLGPLLPSVPAGMEEDIANIVFSYIEEKVRENENSQSQ